LTRSHEKLSPKLSTESSKSTSDKKEELVSQWKKLKDLTNNKKNVLLKLTEFFRLKKEVLSLNINTYDDNLPIWNQTRCKNV